VIPSEIARRYARALFELGQEQGNLDQLTREVVSLAEAYDSSGELQAALENPLVAIEAKRGILNDLAGLAQASPTVRHTLLLLGDRRRVRALPQIARSLRELTDAQRGVVRAEVISARPLSAEYSAKLQAELERLTGKKVALDTRIDASILAGVIARIGDTIYDGSLKARLSQIKTQMLPN
jgi:F-type H+-transporting ATPase subunit delta